MKTTIFLFPLFLLPLHTNAQTNDIMKKIPVINADYEFLKRDSIFFGKGKKENRIRIVDNDTINVLTTETSYREYDKNRKLREIRDSKTHMSEWDYSENQLFKVYRRFYPTGEIQFKGVSSIYGFRVGKWYYYDEKGNLIEVVDHDKGFDFTMEDIFAFCLANNISLEERGLFAPATGIRKYTDAENRTFWFITYRDYTKGKTIMLQIDAKTGAVVKTSESNLPTE